MKDGADAFYAGRDTKMETIIAILIVFGLFIAGLVIAVRLGLYRLKGLFRFECECDGDEFQVQEDEDAAKVRKDQALRFARKRAAAEEFYNTGGTGGQHNPLPSVEWGLACPKCGEELQYVIKTYGDGGGGKG